MHEEIRASRLRVTRRRALSIGGTLGLGGFIAACGGGEGGGGKGGTTTVETTAGTTATVQPATSAGAGVVALLDRATTCALAAEATQGPYWFDVDSIRSDVREDRPGTRLELALRVQDMSRCEAGGEAAPVSNAVVEIWHCDAGGGYSGFESGAMGGPGGPDQGAGETSDGSYSQGDAEAATSDDGTYLRGAQATDRNGVAQFTTIYPGWYQGRTVHIHLKVHVDKRTVLTTQLYFDEALNDAVFAAAPYDERGGRDTTNDSDGIFDAAGLLDVSRDGDGYLGVINLGVNA